MARGAISLAAIPSMASLVNLSNELLIQISDYLYLPDLEYFAFLSPRIFNVCQQRIEEHQQSRNNHRRKDQTRWRMGHPDLSWTDFFNEMCRLDCAPYVHELILERRTEVGGPSPRLTPEELAAFIQFVRASPYILPNEEDELVELASKKDQDPFLCVILPLL